MKKQFAIKPAQVLKSITNAQQAAKKESINVLNFLLADDSPCCKEWDLSRMVAVR